MKPIINDKGHAIGRELNNGTVLDGKGKIVARYIESSNRTVNNKGRNIGIGDQRIRELGKDR